MFSLFKLCCVLDVYFFLAWFEHYCCVIVKGFDHTNNFRQYLEFGEDKEEEGVVYRIEGFDHVNEDAQCVFTVFFYYLGDGFVKEGSVSET